MPYEGAFGADAAGMVERRLYNIVKAVGGRDVRTNGDELWFVAEDASRLEIRLAADLRARCYDRSTNFTISYGGELVEQAQLALREVVDCIKAVDDSPLAEVATVFQAAAAHTASRFATDRTDHPGGGLDAMPTRYSGVDWERPATRELNVIFLDLCAALMGKKDQPLLPLHWGFWPTHSLAGTSKANDSDPFEAFSENLLAYVPESATHILDVGCGLGANARLLASRHKRVTALSPVAHHCAIIAAACLPGVDVQCGRFEEFASQDRYDLLLFSESLNHFDLSDAFFEHCKQLLVDAGFLLMADDLSEERLARFTAQRVFRVIRSVDITANVAPTRQWLAQHMRAFSACRSALLSILQMHDGTLATRVRDILDHLDSRDLRTLFSGQLAPPTPKGRYMIHLLQLPDPASKYAGAAGPDCPGTDGRQRGYRRNP